MTKIAYLKCPTGIAGDMCLSALVDAGVPWDYLTNSLASLGISDEYELLLEQVYRNSQLATKVLVNLHHEETSHHHHASARHLPEITQIIRGADIPVRAKDWSLQVFQQLAIAEGAVHGVSPDKVHFHEVGATDAIIDIVGTCLGLDWLGIAELYCSALPTGGGTVKAAHGRLSVPVPAVLELWKLRQVPVYSNGIEKELVTPTGAAIATTLAQGFGSPPQMTIEKVGLGAGSQDLTIPNILQLWIGNTTAQSSLKQETITVLETQIDDLNPQAVAYTLERLLQAGALDVFTQGITMKKSRSGILLTVICLPNLTDTCKEIIFRETTTLGIRERIQPRSILNRQIHTVKTQYGAVRVKVANWDESTDFPAINIQPEYEDCAKLAREHDIPWRTIQQAAISQIGNRFD
ncbi:putative nickel insertion protein [Hyella patelloides LEGE 07179]|uniref:Putative nickel insertion protein n=1 Tax=Hyella patelloides LEGE 07179 TaxID=945734 RepID=A0A563VSS3_9CYAN|nr:nickel pincer cofactor biosynthesis protein LarC [Hyella patelloides]VEP14461.1 putative nickel insertion protein [Hyella patelloides LEGE 07179]